MVGLIDCLFIYYGFLMINLINCVLYKMIVWMFVVNFVLFVFVCFFIVGVYFGVGISKIFNYVGI